MFQGTEADVQQLARMWLIQSMSVRNIADAFHISPSATMRKLDKYGMKGKQGQVELYSELYKETVESGEAAKITPIQITIPVRAPVKPLSADDVSIHWSDVHFPFQDSRAVEILYQITQDIQPSILAAQGDILDFWQLSHHRPPLEVKLKPHQIDLQSNLEAAAEHLGIMSSLAQPDAPKYLPYGNHEDRWNRKLAEFQNDPRTRQLMMLPKINEVMNLDYQLGLKESGWESYEYMGGRPKILNDRLLIIHGHKSTKWASRSLLEDYGKSLIFGHSHRIQDFTKTYTTGQIAAWNIGCLCDTNPHWRPHVDWAQGFAVVTWKKLNSKWYFNVEQVRIHEGIGIYRDKIYRA